MFLNDFKFIFPELFLLISSLGFLLYGSFFLGAAQGSNAIGIKVMPFTYLLQLSVLVSFFTFFLIFVQPDSFWFQIFAGLFVVDEVSKVFKCFLTFLVGVVFLLTWLSYYNSFTLNFRFEYCILLFFSLFSMYCLVQSQDLLTLYLSFEFQSFIFYTLATWETKSRKSTEAGLKYFILGSIASSFILFGISFVYMFSGLTNFTDLFRAILTLDGNFSFKCVYFGFFFIILGVLFKFPVAPFHVWAPDVYEGSPTFITAFFVLVPKFSIYFIFCKIIFEFWLSNNFNFYFTILLSFLGLLSILIGSFGAFFQFKIKRLLAYSTISHMGFVILSLSTFSIDGFIFSFFYLLIYIVLSLNFFTVFIFFSNEKNERMFNLYSLFEVDNLGFSLGSMSMALSLFSLAGVPPLIGFFSKFLVFNVLFENSMYFVAFFSIFLTVLSCAYYLRIIRYIYFDNFTFHSNYYFYVNYYFKFFLILLTFFNVFFCFFINFFFKKIEIIFGSFSFWMY